MPFQKFRARLNAVATRLHARFALSASAAKRSFHAGVDWTARNVTGLGQGTKRGFEIGRDYAKAGLERSVAAFGLAKNWTVQTRPMVAAFFHRYGYLIFYILALAGIFSLGWKLWRYYAVGDLFHKNKQDTQHATDYYAVNVIFLPLQTLLLVLASLVGGWTLIQNRKFKQHDVEATCVRDYLALEDRLENAGGDGPKLVAAIRAYWTLMVYEYYWWRRGLLSHGVFTIWCEFRVQRFRDDPAYKFNPDAFGAGVNPPFTNYRGGFEFCKTKKVFRTRPSVCREGRPSFFNLPRCEGHLPFRRSRRYHASNSLLRTISSPVLMAWYNSPSPATAFIEARG
jgi:hypothetical protein